MKLLVSIAILGMTTIAHAQELETETARLLPQGAVKAGVGFEYQTSADGSESAVPVFVEGGLLDRLELVVEPVAFTRIHPSVGSAANGVGDTEVTLVGLAVPEANLVPALAVAAEIKIPTARDRAIGTRELDYAAYAIASKRIGPIDLHVNLSYTIVGAPANTQVDNIFGFAVAGRYWFDPAHTLELFGEVYGNTAATPEGEMGTSAELSNGELVGSLGVGYALDSWLLVHLGVSYDNNQAFGVHPGLIARHDFL